MTIKNARICRKSHPAAKQQGVVLFVALIVLVIMTMAGIALVRSVDTDNLIAGNLAFKQSTIQASDLGVEAALTAIPTLNREANAAYKYYATKQADGFYSAWTSANWTNAYTAGGTPSGYTVRYVIDRFCDGTIPVTDIQGNCYATTAATGGNSLRMGAPKFTTTNQVYYRATIRVEGPHNSITYAEAILTATP